MLKPTAALVVLAISPWLLALSPEQCEPMLKAHHALETASFEATRSFSFHVNGKLKRRDVVRLNYSNGTLESEILEEEILSKSIVLEGDGDPLLELEFSCERLTAEPGDRWTLLSADGTETAQFIFDREAGALRPLAWRFQTREKFLFKKFDIEGRADYTEFEWTQ